MTPTLIVGLNPGLQRILTFSSFHLDQINRASSCAEDVGGKGQNFARAYRSWNPTASCRLFQFLGGWTGQQLARWQAEEGIETDTVWVPGSTRICTTLLNAATQHVTEVIDSSELIPPTAHHTLIQACNTALTQPCAALALCGSFPPGVSAQDYASWVRLAHRAGIPVLLDAWQEMAPVLAEGVTLLKINEEELAKITSLPSVPAGIAFLRHHYNIAAIGITSGSAGGWFSDQHHRLWRLHIAPLESAVQNPIGAGDTASAIFLSEWLKGNDPLEAFTLGLATATASCLNLAPARFDLEHVRQARTRIQIEAVDGARD